MPLLSVAVVTLNEEENIRRTLQSVHCADEIIVVDSGSTDRTLEIARSFGAIVYERAWPGYSAQKNFAIGECTGTWVLSLDADEELSPALQEEIRSILPANPPIDGYSLRRRNMFLGRWLRHGGFYPDAKLRLFRRTAASFAAASEVEDRPVHEALTFDGAEGTLDNDIFHHAYPTLSTFIQQMDRYSSRGADLIMRRGFGSESIPAFVLNVFVYPQLTFAWNYIVRLGFLDGREGLLVHLYHATYTSWKFAKAWEMARKQHRGPALRTEVLDDAREREAA